MKLCRLCLGGIIIILLACLVIYCSAAQGETVNETYVIKSGDTLCRIALKIYGDESKWRDIWDMNRFIENPHLIFPGQILNLDPKVRMTKQKPVDIPPLNPESFRLMAQNLMFKVNRLPRQDKDVVMEYLVYVGDLTRSLINQHRFAELRVITRDIGQQSRILETYALADAITKVYNEDKDLACILLALAWQETQFINRRGRAGERGYYQFLPATIKGLHADTSDIVLAQLEYDPYYATEYAKNYILALKKEHGNLRTVFLRYNGHVDYVDYILHKYNKIRKEARL